MKFYCHRGHREHLSAVGEFTRRWAAEVLVTANKFKLIRKRESYEDLIELEK